MSAERKGRTRNWRAEVPGDDGGLDAHLGQLVAQKGWRSAKDVLTSYQNLERLVGADKLALPARDAGPEAWAPVWEKLGRPTDATGYSFAAPHEGAYDQDAADWLAILRN